jgi:hypothetical protein
MKPTRHPALPLAGVALTCAALVASHFAATWTAGAHGSTTRYADPIVIAGDDLVGLEGAPLGELSVWQLHHDSWQRVLAQVDERDATGLYAATEDRVLDANDELVFVLGDLGEEAAEDAWPPDLNRAGPRLEAKITDPLDAEFVSYYYIFASGQAAGEPLQPVVAWDAAVREVRTAEYIMGPAAQETDGFFGIKRLSLYSDPTDLVDRLKLRGTLSALGFELPVNEETINGALALVGADLSFAPVIFGPVRVVLSANGGFAYANRFALFGGFGALDNLPGGAAGFDIKDGRLSLDFSPEAKSAIYTDPNVPAGVPIDSQPDKVPDAPVPAWRQIDFTAGRLVVLSNSLAADAKARGYYRDDSSPADGDTGDQQSWGEHGVSAPDLQSLVATGFAREAVVLPAGRDVSSDQLAKNLAAPLEAVVTSLGGALPTVTRAATSPATATHTPTRTRTPEATPTGGPSLLYDIYLPYLVRAAPTRR